MKLQHLIGSLGLGLALLITQGCGPQDAEAQTSQGASVAAEAKDPSIPDTTGLEARSAERWEVIAAGDWIQAYDYHTPQMRKQESLGRYLSGKENHEYRNPSKPHLIGTEEDLAYVEVSVLWEPHHPILQTVRDRPDDLTEELVMVEIWRWVDGEWYFVKNERHDEFVAANPQIVKQAGKSASVSEDQ